METYFNPKESNYYSEKYEPHDQNWFTVLTGDNLGQISIGNSVMHRYPQEPIIDSIYYVNQSFTLHRIPEPDEEFIHNQILETWDENPYNLSSIDTVFIRTDTTLLLTNIIES